MFKKDYGAYICENGKYLKDIADTSVVVCDKIINAINSIKKCDNLICLLFVNVRKYITTRHLNLSYISILSNLYIFIIYIHQIYIYSYLYIFLQIIYIYVHQKKKRIPKSSTITTTYLCMCIICKL